MSDDLTARIDEALDGTTPGPRRVRPGRVRTVEIVREYDGGSSWFIVVHQMHDGADAALIAAAPSLLAEARDEIARLEQWRADATEVLAGLRLLDAPPTQPGGGT